MIDIRRPERYEEIMAIFDTLTAQDFININSNRNMIKKIGDRKYNYGLYHVLAHKIYEEQKGKSVLFLPMATGGSYSIQPISSYFFSVSGEFEWKKIYRDREGKMITEPTIRDLRNIINKMKDDYNKPIIPILHDDVFMGGTDIMMLFDYLIYLRHEGVIDVEYPLISALYDSQGIADYCVHCDVDKEMDKEVFLKGLKEKGDLPQTPNIKEDVILDTPPPRRSDLLNGPPPEKSEPPPVIYEKHEELKDLVENDDSCVKFSNGYDVEDVPEILIRSDIQKTRTPEKYLGIWAFLKYKLHRKV